MSEIPDDIMIAARRLMGPPRAVSPEGNEVMARMIAKVILAERERCAVIAEGMFGDPSWESHTQGSHYGFGIARKIRGEG